MKFMVFSNDAEFINTIMFYNKDKKSFEAKSLLGGNKDESNNFKK